MGRRGSLREPEDAEAAVRALVEHDEGSDRDFRVQKVTREMA